MLSAGAQQRYGSTLLLAKAMGIEVQRRPGRAVSEQRADRFDIHAQFEQACGKRVPQGVKVWPCEILSVNIGLP